MRIGMITAPRPNGVSYIEKTLDSLCDAGGRDVFVQADYGSPSPIQHPAVTRCLECTSQRGNWHNWLWCARQLVWMSETSGDEFVLVCEDDVLFCENAIMIAENILEALCRDNDDVGFLAMYTAKMYQDKMDQPVQPLWLTSMWGACALAFPVKSLGAIVESRRATTWRGIGCVHPLGSSQIRHADTCIGECCIELGLRGFFMKPGLVQHVGEVSTLRGTPMTADRSSVFVGAHHTIGQSIAE